jgi:hypothetical protein
MTVKEQIYNAGLSGGVYTAEDFLRHARPAIFGVLNDSQKHAFIRMAGREQKIYMEAMLEGLGIKMPALLP